MRTLLKMTWIELKLFVREPVTMVFTFALPLIFLFVLGGVFQNIPSEEFRDAKPMDYYTPAYIGLVIASILGLRSLAIPSAVCCAASAPPSTSVVYFRQVLVSLIIASGGILLVVSMMALMSNSRIPGLV
jgi:ABC-2 type transport system permease protein